MASQELSARLRFLHDSAHLLATAAPATSRHLMSKCNSILFDSGLDQSDAQKRQACGCCGNIMILGHEATLRVQVQPHRMKSGKAQKHAASSQKELVYTCNVCDRATRFKMPTPAVKRRSMVGPSSKTKISVPSQPAISQSPPVVTSTNASSKKRAKARKGGLGALLASKKAAEAQQSGFGMDLLDFMKKS